MPGLKIFFQVEHKDLFRAPFVPRIHNMPLTVESSLPHFADDSILYKAIKKLADTHILQNDLDKLVLWENNQSMEFHPEKCKLLRITNKRKIVDASYFIHGVQLEKVEQAKYLGVTKNLNSKKHINNIISKATNVRLYLQRNLNYFDKKIQTVML